MPVSSVKTLVFGLLCCRDKKFEPKPALVPLCKYIKEEIVYKYPHEKCALCGEYALPRDPQVRLDYGAILISTG